MGPFFDGVVNSRKGPFQAGLHWEAIGLVVLLQGRFWVVSGPIQGGDGGLLHRPKVCEEVDRL